MIIEEVLTLREKGPPPAVSPLKLSPKALKLTRPQVGAIIHTEEELHYYFAEILEAVKAGALRVSTALKNLAD
jgi:NADPH2:quinone reductase